MSERAEESPLYGEHERNYVFALWQNTSEHTKNGNTEKLIESCIQTIQT